MYEFKIIDATRSLDLGGLRVKIAPAIESTEASGLSGNIFLPIMSFEQGGMIVGKKYYLLSEDEYTPPVEVSVETVGEETPEIIAE